jgi:nucleotide-binding universal stress UspA family protein
MLGSRLGRLTVATVISFEASERDGEERAEAEEILRRAVAATTVCRPETIILVGQPSEALVEYAHERYYDLLAVGSRGRGISKAILGSVASQLVRQARVPVLVAGSVAR